MAGQPVDMSKVIPLVTGGGSGIGLGLVEEFLKRGSPKVLITGRREEVLKQAAAKHEGKVFYCVSDAGSAADRAQLLEWVIANHSDCNALVNNAGIQRRIPPALDTAPWEERAPEIEINFAGPVHLCSIFTPHLLSKELALLINVSSGLAFIPFAPGPVYSATKAALHNYTLALRYSLAPTSVRVIEIIPPAVKSNLGGSHDFGEDCAEFCESVMARVEAGEEEVGFKMSEAGRLAPRAQHEQMMASIAEMQRCQRYAPSA
mmetsp:Transcript_36865/g.80848  ORF Transcript_36865/g.80848 Transcript_36865/m.80848 type:complete len:261 (-) Transcript_36865:114-896(-)